MELIAGDETVVYRNFIEGAGSRAIGVGYPAGVNLAFDANNLSIALIWQGAFIDAKRHWTGRGQGYEPPKGENVKALGQAVSFASLENLSTPWPTQSARDLGYRFRGYRLSEDRSPTFMYSIDQTRITDAPAAVETATSLYLKRTLTVSRPTSLGSILFYRAAVSDAIRDAGDGWFELADDLKVSLHTSSQSKPTIRESNGKFELLIPIVSDSVTITQEYAW